LLSILLVLVLLDIAPGLAFLGPAVATVTATYIQVGLLVVLIGWHLDWPFQTLLPWARLGAVLGLSCGAALIAWFAATASDSASIKIVLGGGVFASVVALSYGAVPAFKAELRAVWSGVHER
jgi:hypothetical protein